MSHRDLSRLGARRDAEFYQTALRYSQYLWSQRYPARAILSLSRALYAPLVASDPVLEKHPLPYRGYGWMLAHYDGQGFIGNPRISFQHQCLRIRGRNGETRKARAHALWWLTCRLRPDLDGDPRCVEPDRSFESVCERLRIWGLPQERFWFAQAVDEQTGGGNTGQGTE